MNLALCCATMQSPNDYPGKVATWMEHVRKDVGIWCHICRNSKDHNLGVVGSYQKLYAERSSADILCYIHDDVTMHEQGWDQRILAEFNDPQVAVVGLGGARRHGHPDLYKVPYKLEHLARGGYLSNVDDAEVHGKRFEGSCDVAVLDGFTIAVRRSFLDEIGGWKWMLPNIDFYCYDYAICAMARRHGYRVRLVGLRCHHHGGATSVKVKGLPITSQEAYDRAHAAFYLEFADVMPYEVPR